MITLLTGGCLARSGHLNDIRAPQGLEPDDVTSSVPEDLRQTPNQRAAKNAAVGDDFPPIDPETF